MTTNGTEVANISVGRDGRSGMVRILNSFTGKSFSLTPEEAETLQRLLNSLLTPESSNPPSDQL